MQPNNLSAYLIIRQGTRWTDVFRLDSGRSLIVGRASSNEIPVADERSSRRHAEIFFEEGSWKVRDLGSRNGTFVDGIKLEASKALLAGNQITVASCRMTFANSLEEVVPTVESEDSDPQSNSHTQAEIPAITHRQSKSNILDPTQFSIGTNREATSARLAQPPRSATSSRSAQSQKSASSASPAMAAELLQLAYEVARESTVQAACELALSRLLLATDCLSGGILRLASESTNASSYTVLAALQRSGKAYHPVGETLAANVLRDNTAVLARNLLADSHAIGGSNVPTREMSSPAKLQASHLLTTTSVILAPMRIAERTIGFVHLYTRIDESELTAEHLEIALSVADVLAVTLGNIQRQQSLEVKLKTSRSRIHELEQQLGQTSEWIGPSLALKQLREQAQRVGPTHATVLIRGESGSGKELVARAIHDFSSRANGPFVALNCAALTATLLESELFGHEKGAFTGATERKLGKFEQANGGTIMLDELGEMSLEIQAKFLRVLEGKAFERVGGSKPIQVDVRVVAATNRDLEQAVEDGNFRSDLYFRLRVIELRVPSLRQRPDDILPLANHFLSQFRARSGHGPSGFSDRAQLAMKEYHWPGNVRELRNCVERAYVLATGELAEPEDLALSYLKLPNQPTETGGTAVSQGYQEKTMDALEQEHIHATLEYTNGQKNRAAAILGIERSTLDRKLKRFQT